MTGQVTNWAGNVEFRAGRVHRPASVAELQRLVASAERLRPLGTGHSFNRIADTDGDQVSLADLPATVAVDKERQQVTASAAVRYGELVTRLHEAGYALPGLASLPHISVAGACATGTHGSGNRVGNLATAVSALELVTGTGELVRMRRGEREFDGAVVGLGALGVVTSLTLDLVPTFEVRQYVYDAVPFASLAAHWEQIFAVAYSVSIFTSWTDVHANWIWRKQRVDDPEPSPEWLGGRLADGPRHPIPGGSPVHSTEQLGAPGPWHLRLPHFRLEFTPSSGVELQSEYLLPRHRAGEALAALDQIRDRIAPVLQICELRTVAADQLWLSPSYQRETVAIHFTWIADQAAVAPVIAAVEEQLAPLDARPHWGKLFSITPEAVRDSYPRWRDFADLARELDPTGTFHNEFLDRYLPD